MNRKLLAGCALVAALAVTVGCGGGSSGPSKEEMDKKAKENMEKMKMGGPGGAAPGGAAPGGAAPMADPMKKS